MPDNNKYTEFINFLKEKSTYFLDYIREKNSPILLVSHYDADGLCSASLFTYFLQSKNHAFQLKIIEELTTENIEKIYRSNYETIIFTDLGSGMNTYIYDLLRDRMVFIIDHHKPLSNKTIEENNFHEINPIFFEIDGSKEASSSTLTYLFLRNVDEKIVKYGGISLVGALGDRQDIGKRYSLIGLNSLIVKEAEKYNIINIKIGLRLFGVSSRPIVKALEYTMDPFIPGISGNESLCIKFLKEIGIAPTNNGKYRPISSLSPSEIKKLATELIKYMLLNKIPVREAERIFGMKYFLSNEPPNSSLKDLREFAYMINACGRLGYYGTAIMLCLGKRGEILARAYEHAQEYRRILAKTMSNIRESKEIIKKEFNNFLFLNLNNLVNEKITGAIASILANSLHNNNDKILLVVASRVEKKFKISVRKLTRNISKEIHIGEILEKVSKKFNGVGGGHRDAGGALVDEEFLEDFLSSLDKFLQ